MGSESAGSSLQLTDVTMMESVNALRDRRYFIQFEREQLDNQNTDYSRPVVDSSRRFTVSLSLNRPAEHILETLTQADGGYDWIQLTEEPASYWIFPRSEQGDRFGASAMAWQVGDVSTAGRNLSEIVSKDLGLEAHQITVFDRPNFLGQVESAPMVTTTGRPLYQVLGDLFAFSGKEIVWTLGGLGPSRVLTIGRLPPP